MKMLSQFKFFQECFPPNNYLFSVLGFSYVYPRASSPNSAKALQDDA